MLENGLVMTHDFGGRQGWEVAAALLQSELPQIGLPTGWFIPWRISEPVKKSREAIQTGNQMTRPQHAYAFVEDISLPTDAEDRYLFDRKRPSPEGSLEEWLQYNKWFDQYVKEHANRLFYKGQISRNCKTHPGIPCPVRWEDSRPPCDKAMTIIVAGPHCLPWTRSGDQKGLAHPAQEHYSLCIGEHASALHDISMVEEAPFMPPEHYVLMGQLEPQSGVIYCSK
jgi:hypothetical protein